MKMRSYRGVLPLLAMLFLAVMGGGVILAGCNGGGSGPLGGGDAFGGGGAGSGNGNGNGGGASTVSNFSVTPNRAVPGDLVTLQGIRLNSSDGVTVKFGDREAFVQNRTGDLQVVTPVFLTNGQAVTPSAPVSVTVTLDSGTTAQSTNQVTILPLPAAPGTTEAVLAELDGLGEFLEGLGEEGLLRFTTGEDAAFDRNAVLAMVAYAQAYRDLIGGANNPDSLKNVLNGTSPLVAGAPLPRDVQDALLAQGQTRAQLGALARALVDAVREVKPEAVQIVASKKSLGGRVTDTDFGLFREAKIDWKSMTPGELAVVTIKSHQALKKTNEFLGFFEPLYGLFADNVSIILSGFPATAPYAKAIDVSALLLGVSSKLIANLTATLPGTISGFYTSLAGKPGAGRPGQNPPTLQVGDRVQVDLYIVPTAPGGKLFTAVGLVKDLILPFIRIRLPQKFRSGNEAADKQLDEIAAKVVGRVIGLADLVWSKVAGEAPPQGFFDRASLTFGAPTIKHSPVKVNDHTNFKRSATVRTTSTNIINVLPLQQYFIEAVAPGQNAGYEGVLVDNDLVAAARDGNTNSVARAVVNVAQPQPTPTPGGGSAHLPCDQQNEPPYNPDCVF